MAINYSDPRYQNAVLTAHANPRKNPAGIQKQITGRWAKQQQGVLNQFRDLKNRDDYFKQRLDLRKDRHRFASNMFKRRLNNERDALNQGIYMGLGTSLIAGLIGRDNRLKSEAAGAKQQEFYIKEALKASAHRREMKERF